MLVRNVALRDEAYFFKSFARRDLVRAALFGWTILSFAALSRCLNAAAIDFAVGCLRANLTIFCNCLRTPWFFWVRFLSRRSFLAACAITGMSGSIAYFPEISNLYKHVIPGV